MRLRTIILIMVIIIINIPNIANGQSLNSKKAVYLITSAECGYCIVNTPFYNMLSELYSPYIKMVALNASREKDMNKIKKQFPDKEVELKKWVVIPNARKEILKLVERETYPQIILVDNDKVVARHIGTIKPVKDSIEVALNRFVER